MNFQDIIRNSFLLGLYFLYPFWLKNKGYAVLVYHRIVKDEDWQSEIIPELYVRLSDFVRQMEFIKKKCRVIPLSEAVRRIRNKIKPDALYVSVSFDDGYKDNITLGGSVLKKNNIQATIFITAGYVENNKIIPYWDKLAAFAKKKSKRITILDIKGRKYYFNLNSRGGKRNFYFTICGWDYQNSKFTQELVERMLKENNFLDKGENDFLSWDLLRQAIVSGNYEIGCHTMTHPVLGSLEDHGTKEINESKNLLEQRLSVPIELFSYPLGGAGAITPEVMAVVRENGFQAAFTNDIGLNSEEESLFLLKRITIRGDQGFSAFKSKLYAANFLKWLYLFKK